MASQSRPATIVEDRRESDASMEIEMDDLDGIISNVDQQSQAITGPKDVQSNLLEGLTFVVSGTFENISRNDLEEFIEAKGGKKTTGVSGKTNYLIIGKAMEDGRDITSGGKYKKAKEKNVNIFTEE